MAKILWAMAIAAAVSAAGGDPAAAQDLAANDPRRSGRCDPVEATIRLRLAHPLGAASSSSSQCLDHRAAWVPTTPMGDTHREAWRRALAALDLSPDRACRLAASTLVWLEQVGAVSVWAPADTAAGLVYYGASYVTESTSPLAVQFWASAFDRPVDWLAGAMAHEAFHILHAEATEGDALAFGRACARSLPNVDLPRPAAPTGQP